MFRYIIERLLLVLPTMFIVLIFSFILKSLAPGDEIASQLEVEGNGRSVSKTEYLSSYQKLSKDLGFDKPVFYIDLKPSYFPDTLNRIIPKSKKILLTSVLRETQNWEEVSKLKNLLLSAQTEVRKFPQLKKAYNEIQKLNQDKSLSDLKSRVIGLRSILKNIDQPLLETRALMDKVESLKRETSFSLPSLKWHGTQNQFHLWMLRIFDSSKNVSLIDGESALTKILRALKWTMSLSIITLILVIFISLGLGYSQVLVKDSVFDKVVSFILYILYAIPTFWLASLLVVFFTTAEYGSWTDIFPSVGIKPAFVKQSFLTQLLTNAQQLILPVFCLTLVSISYLTIQLKSDLLSALKKPFVLMAKAKGLPKEKVLSKHALPNALVPFITSISGSLPSIFTGSVIIEVIFNIPGIGRLMLYSAEYNDWPVLFSIVIIISIATIISYLLGDILLMVLYPKTKKGFNLSSIEKTQG